jgi:hypothetical protein
MLTLTLLLVEAISTRAEAFGREKWHQKSRNDS